MGMEAVTFMKSHGHRSGLLEEAPQTVPSSHGAQSQLGARHSWSCCQEGAGVNRLWTLSPRL